MLRRTLTTAVAAVAIAALAPAPAFAAVPKITPVTITVRGYNTGVFLNGLQINSTCEAHVVGAVAATVITECRIYQEGVAGPNHPAALPHNVVATNFTQRVDTLDFLLCFSAYTIPLHDPTNPVEASGCAYDILPASAGLVSFGEASATE